MNNPFSLAKNLFLEKVDELEFIELDVNIGVRNKLEQLISRVPFQIVLLTGRPGVGKSYLIQDLQKRVEGNKLYVQLFPFLSLNGFLAKLHIKFLPHIPLKKDMTRDWFFKSFSANLSRENLAPVIIIDEAQLYGDRELEVIRMMSDCRFFRFIFVTHALKDKKVLNESYFTSRIWDKIILNELDFHNTKFYIMKKLSRENLNPIIRLLGDNDYKIIYKCTRGNLRLLSRMCFLLFDICEYYYKTSPSTFSKGQMPRQYIEMAAIKLGALDAS